MTKRIAICAPATPITREQAAAVVSLAAAEYPVLDLAFHPQCFVQDGHFAGTDRVRADAFLECANDPGSEAVWFAKGGYGSNRILPEIIAGVDAAARSKTYLGYSDCGFVLGAFYRNGIGQPVHAPMPVDIRRDGGAEAVRRSLAWLAGDKAVGELDLGNAPMAAFNLTTLAMLVGTPFMPDLTGHHLLVEEVAEHLYAVDRLFFHLTSLLPPLAGLSLGEVTAVPENDRPFGCTVEEIARFWCDRADISFLGRAAIGHTAANRIVPFGLAQGPDGA